MWRNFNFSSKIVTEKIYFCFDFIEEKTNFFIKKRIAFCNVLIKWKKKPNEFYFNAIFATLLHQSVATFGFLSISNRKFQDILFSQRWIKKSRNSSIIWHHLINENYEMMELNWKKNRCKKNKFSHASRKQI